MSKRSRGESALSEAFGMDCSFTGYSLPDEPKRLDASYIGVSVSYRTLRPDDLITEFINFLILVDAVDSVGEIIGGYTDDTQDVVWKMLTGEPAHYTDDVYDELAWLLNEDLFDRLNEIAPDGSYFGAHIGDGTDFGFWPIEFLE